MILDIILFSLYFLISILFIEKSDSDKSRFRLTSFLTVCIIGWAFYRKDKFEFLTHISITNIILLSVGYFVVGFIWAVFKWFTICKKAHYRFQDSILDSDSEKDIEWKLKLHKPEIRNYGDSVSTWITYWPLSAVRFIFGDLISTFSKWIFESTKEIFIKISNNTFKNGMGQKGKNDPTRKQTAQ